MPEQNLKVNITGDSSKLNNALTSASSKLSSFGSKMQSVGKSMSMKLTLPLIAAGTAATKLALDFDKSMTQIESLVGVAADEVSEMGKAAKKMATETGRSANEAGQALFFITSAGLRGKEAMDVLEMSLKAAAVGLGETKTIADLSTSAMNAYGSETLSASGATDILTAAVREGKLEASALAGAMGGVIPLASNMGVSFDQVGAAMAAMSKTGTDAATGATQLTAILASLKKPSSQAVDALDAMGMSTEGVQKSLREKGLLDTLIMLQEGLKKTGQDTTALFPNIRALKGVLDLTGAGLEDNKKVFDALTNSMGATDKAFLKTSKSASFQFAKGMATVKNSLTEIGITILPIVIKAVKKFSGFIKGVTDRFKNLSPEAKNFVLTLTGIAMAIGPMLIMFGKLATGISALGPILPIAASGFRLLTAAMIANPIIAVAAAITAIGLAIYKYTQAQKDALNEVLTIEQVEERIAEKRKKLADAQAKVAEGYGGQVKKNVILLEDEIQALEAKKKILKELSTVSVPNSTGVIFGGGNDTATDVSGGGVPTRPMATSAMEGISGAGIQTPISDSIEADTARMPKAFAEQQAIFAQGKLDSLQKAEAFNQRMGQIMTGGLNNLAQGIGAALGNAISTGGNLVNALGGLLLGTIGSIAIQLGKAAIQIGIAMKAIKLSFKNPFTAIAAGIALVAVGTMIKNTAGIVQGGGGGGGRRAMGSSVGGYTGGNSGGGITAFANGGIISGPTMGLVGEYPGARQNPEVIAPLNKLQSIIGKSSNSGNINVTGEVRVDGQDLLIAIERANETAGRVY